MYDITKQSAGKAQVLRISLDRWIAECDIACLCGFILEEMERFRDPKNLTVFSKETLGVLMSRFIEGDFHEELRPMVEVMDPTFKAEQTSMWVESLPKEAISETALVEADEKIDAMTAAHNKLEFERERSGKQPDIQVHAGQVSLSDVQECAQLLCGETMPEMVLTALMENSEVGGLLGVCNLTPYDGHLEISLLKRAVQNPGHNIRSLSLSTDLAVSQYCEKTCALYVFEDWFNDAKWAMDWKHGGKLMGNDVRPYDPRPPPASSLDPASYPLKLASLQVDPKQKGVKKYRIELPNDIRAKHLEDPVNGGTWFCQGISPAALESQIVPVEEEPVAHQEMTIGVDEFQLAHGSSRWLKAERYQKMVRESAGWES
ncbi:Uncharacterized protein SCF082_LOCUS18814 [Durusdinium trenchii]|uniref:Uncharacterized protein n=1 Tax=Durusdinium trenchii TaxID=1381693 RepID=A0ABP0KRJ5_9DINO